MSPAYLHALMSSTPTPLRRSARLAAKAAVKAAVSAPVVEPTAAQQKEYDIDTYIDLMATLNATFVGSRRQHFYSIAPYLIHDLITTPTQLQKAIDFFNSTDKYYIPFDKFEEVCGIPVGALDKKLRTEESVAPELDPCAAFIAAEKEYLEIKEEYEEITYDCFGLYILEEFEEGYTAGNRFRYMRWSSEEDLMTLGNGAHGASTYVIIPITKCANGKTYTRFKQPVDWHTRDKYKSTFTFDYKNPIQHDYKDISEYLYEYEGECKVLLASRQAFDEDEHDRYKNPNPRTWISLTRLKAGGDGDAAIGTSASKMPEEWQDYNISKGQMCIMWQE